MENESKEPKPFPTRPAFLQKGYVPEPKTSEPSPAVEADLSIPLDAKEYDGQMANILYDMWIKAKAHEEKVLKKR